MVSKFVAECFKPRKATLFEKLQILSQVIVFLDENLPPAT